jgi:O-antigen biosynthesis protein
LTDLGVYFQDPRPDVQAVVAARDKRILDVGCAAGALGQALKAAGAREVIGVERFETAAAQARHVLDAVYVGDIDHFVPPVEEASFDYVIFADVLEHTVDPWQVLERYQRFLKPDGRMVVSLPNIRHYAILGRLLFNRWDYRESGILDRTHLRFFTLPTIRALFAHAGLHIERIVHRYRLFEDQSRIGRVGALANRWFCRLVAPVVGKHFFTFQYLLVARRADGVTRP